MYELNIVVMRKFQTRDVDVEMKIPRFESGKIKSKRLVWTGQFLFLHQHREFATSSLKSNSDVRKTVENTAHWVVCGKEM